MNKKLINLLPPEEQRQNSLLEINFQVVRLGLTATATILALGIGLFGASLFFETSLHGTEASIEENKQVLAKFQKAGLEAEILELNEAMTNFNSLVSKPTKWSPYLLEIASLMPDDVTVDILKIDAATRRVEISGTSESRRSVLQFRENVLRSRRFENINFPLANLEIPSNVPWKFRFYLKSDAP